jgi:hypothetical protein
VESGWTPQLILSNPPSFAHFHLAERLGVPLQIFFTMPWSPSSTFPHPLTTLAWNPQRGWINRLSFHAVNVMTWLGLGDILNRFRVELGLRKVPPTMGPFLLSTIPHVYLWSPSLLPPSPEYQQNPLISIAGFLYFPLQDHYQPPKELADFLQSGPPPLYIGFGSIVLDNAKEVMSKILQVL